MDPTNSNKTSQMGRRISTRNSVRISVNGGDEDFELAAGLISDGFRPVQQPRTESESSAPSFVTPSTSASSVDQVHDIQPRAPPTSRPSSVSKPHRPEESLSLRHDGGMGSIDASARLARSSSVSTDSVAYVHVESPYRGPDGPSHPYQLYPQNVRLARTMSTTTASTDPVSESSYAGLRAPAHPYGLYPQDTAANPISVPAPAIPLGFHGLPDQYQRRIGPEGEDIADMIGPDGHTEQLPPYTRYPDDAYAQKAIGAEGDLGPAIGGAMVIPAGLILPTSTTREIPGAGGIGLATRNPEFESMDDLGSPQSRHSSRSFASDTSHHDINTAAAGLSEKHRPSKTWQAWMRRRLWGIIPFWAIFLTGVVLLLMGAILGGVIGAFLDKQHKKPPRPAFPNPNLMPTTTATPDATPIPTPSDLPPLPIGTFGMPLVPSRVSPFCLNDTSQSQSWGCYFVISGLYMTISRNSNAAGSDYSVSNNVYSYGEQPPLVENPVSLELVNDTVETGRGPAWFKMLPYNKTVVLPAGALSPSTSVSNQRIRRLASAYDPGIGDFRRKGVLGPGDTAWVCTWPNTYLELFIYAQQNSSWSGFKPPSSSPSSLPSSSTASSSSSSAPSPPSSSSAPPSSTASDAAGHHIPTGSFQYGGSPTGEPQYNGYYNHISARSPTNPTTLTPTSPYGPIDTGEGFTPPPPPYPRVIKLEERRMPDAPAAQCTQVQVQERGEPAKPVRDSKGNIVSLAIAEKNPVSASSTPTADVSKRSPREHLDSSIFQREGDAENQCSCVWFLT
ncbi:hypothetical protein B0T26DRAFT_743085 [Lasiosphaeria miniovina]|uniref:DUF7820 domain-containing protein n=1 Tax=Lasiosphaeria miniovina TaxID=1954250 RepID=A0AA40A5W3_9PEZI|nr:uncharacterized protein B0T26DRAFT_743085 [Lasiosphaeria miniovina]KAK0709723.1 hypothetical protein B0T26DRAFT_743085 [Lasiosphaeria miniovina]